MSHITDPAGNTLCFETSELDVIRLVLLADEDCMVELDEPKAREAAKQLLEWADRHAKLEAKLEQSP